MTDTITELSQDDRRWLCQAEAHILAVAHAKFGVSSFSHTNSDLSSLQPLIDDGSVSKDILEAQCIGAVLGNVCEADTSMRWVRVANEYGDMIALYGHETRFTLYPLTMISKRLEDGRHIDLLSLYEDLSTSLNINP